MSSVSSPEPGAARIYVRASSGVQSREGMNFGRLVWVEGVRLHLQVDVNLRPLEPVTLRVDLSPAPGTALVSAEVMRVLAGTATEPQAYLLRVTEIATDDRLRWRQFLTAKSKGGTLSDLSDVRDSTGALRSSYTATAERERAAAVARMSGASSSPPLPRSQASSTFSSTSSGPNNNRAAMRDALRSAMSGAPRPPDPAPTPGAAPGRSVAPAASVAPARPRVEAPPSVAPGTPARVDDDPTWLASPTPGRTYLQVTWRSEQAFSYDVHSQLASGVLTLSSDGRPLPSTGAITALLRYESLVVQAPASAIRVLPLSATYRLELSPGQLVDLRRMARDPSTISTVGGKPR